MIAFGRILRIRFWRYLCPRALHTFENTESGVGGLLEIAASWVTSRVS
jgi:hypothetical protein